MRGLAYLLGIVSGFGLTLQIGMNSQLRTVLQSANTAALISFLVGTVASRRAARWPRVRPCRDATRWPSVPAWAWFGGLMGAFYVAISTVVASQLGTASLLGLALAGAAGHGAGRRSLRLDGSARASDYPYSPGRCSLAGRRCLADLALRTALRTKVHQGH